ncbi:MAG: hypothetical protein IJB48_00875 [Clostridia bacterium]|nr:hypothetical protein [Clostridia bacterium]
MRKTISLALVFAMLLSLVAFAPAASAATTPILDIDFDDCETTADLRELIALNGESAELVTDPDTGSKVMSVTAAQSVRFALPSGQYPTSGRWVYEFDYKSGILPSVLDVYDDGQGTMFGLVEHDGNRYTYPQVNGSKDSTTQLARAFEWSDGITTAHWHTYSLCFDATNHTVEFYVDGELKYGPSSYSSNKVAKTLRFQPKSASNASTGAVFYIDNISVRPDVFELESAGPNADNSAIEVKFSKPVEGTYLTETYFALTKDGTAQTGYAVTQSGTTVTLTPTGGLGEDGTWGLTVASLVGSTGYGTLGEVYEASFELAEPAGNIKFDWNFEDGVLPSTFAGNAEIVTDDITGSKVVSITSTSNINAFDMSSDLPSSGTWEWSFDIRSSLYFTKVRIYDGNVGSLLGIKGDAGDHKRILENQDSSFLYNAYSSNDNPKGTSSWHNHRFVMTVTAVNAGTYVHYVDGVQAYSGSWSGRSPKLFQIQAGAAPSADRIIYFDNFSFKKARLAVQSIAKDEEASTISLTFNTPVAASCLTQSYFQLTKNGATFNDYTVAQDGSVVTLTVGEGLGADNTWAVTVPKWTTAADAAFGTMRSLYEGSVTTAFVEIPDGTEANVLFSDDYEYADAAALQASLPSNSTDCFTMAIDPQTGSKVLSVNYYAYADDGYNSRYSYPTMLNLPNSGKWEWQFDMKANVAIERFKVYNTSNGGGFGLSATDAGVVRNNAGTELDATLWTDSRLQPEWHTYRFAADMDANVAYMYVDEVLVDTYSFSNYSYNCIQLRTLAPEIMDENYYIYIDNMSLKADHIGAKKIDATDSAINVTMNYEVADSSLTANHFKLAKNGAPLAAADYTIAKNGKVIILTPAVAPAGNDSYTVTVSNQVKAADAAWGTTVVTKALSVTVPLEAGYGFLYDSTGENDVADISDYLDQDVTVKAQVSATYTGHTAFVAIYDGTVLKDVEVVAANAMTDGFFTATLHVPASVADAKVCVFVWDANFKPLEAPIEIYPNR